MFGTFFFKELRMAFARPMVYIFLLIFALLTFGAVSSDSVVIGSSVGNVMRNAPHVLTNYVSVLSLFGLLFAAAFANNTALRDYNHQFHEILFSTPLKKFGFFAGRYLGAFFLSTIPFLGIYLGMWAGTLIAPLAGWIDAERFGPTPVESMVNTFFLFVLPNMFFGTAIVFWLAHRFQNAIVSFVGVLGIIVGYIISGTFLSDVDNETLAALSDPFGVRAYAVYSRYFTPLEKNTLAPSMEGLMLQNRLIWLAASLLLSLFSYLTFKTKLRHGSKLWRKADKDLPVEPLSKVQAPVARARYGNRTAFAQFFSFYRTALRSIIKSTVFKILFIFCVLIIVSNMFGGFEYFGLQAYPITYKMAQMIQNGTAIFLIIIMVFFSGELVWRDRASHIDEVINATPHQSFASLSAKALALVMTSVLLYVFFLILAILFQLGKGFTFIELDVYLGHLVFDSLPGYIFYSCLFIFIQVMFANRYIGYFVSVLLIFLDGLIWSALDISSNMLNIGGAPSLQYSDMNGFGPGAQGAFWFNVYWMLFGFLLLLIAGAYMSRKKLHGFGERWAEMRRTFKGKYALGSLVVLLLWVSTAGFVYYNTQVLNPYYSSDEQEQQQVDYEKQYKQYERYAQPKIIGMDYYIDIFPEERDVYVKADISLQNQSNARIDSLFFTVYDDWKVAIHIPNSREVLRDTVLGFRIYALTQPLDSGAQLNINISSNYISRGFENNRGNTSIVKNGTFLNNGQVLPDIGYVESIELRDKNDRKKYGLAPRPRLPELQENCTDDCMVNYLTDGLSDWVSVETVISTSSDQIAIAPGSLMEKWTQDGRNYYRYKVEQPSQNFYSFISADYQVARRKWQGIDLEVYYDAKHAYNIEMMLDALQQSLEYYTEHFGPYYHKQARIIEFPRYATFAQAFPGTMPYSEGFGFIIDLEGEDKNNVIQAVIAHEMAHQWWAHQEIPAKMQGGTMLTESFSEYSSLMVMKKQVGKERMKDFLKYDFNRYLRGRSGETQKELPLYKVENQSYIHYGKGSVILYALQDYIGEDSVNAALRDFLAEFRYAPPPYPTSYDFLKHLEPRVPDSLQYLIRDWFKEITLYDFRLTEAQYQKTDDGRYLVDIDLEAAKIYADTIGNEERLKPNEWVDIGLYADEAEEELLTVKRIKLDQEKMRVQLEADRMPAKAAIDPYRLLIERITKDNVKKVTEKDE